MSNLLNAKLLLADDSRKHGLRKFRRAVRTAFHCLALVAGMLSSGVLPVGLLTGSSEAEAQQEAPGSQYVELSCDARHQLRRPSCVGHERCTMATMLPTVARRPANSSAYPLTVVRLSSGLTVPLRC
jgi:hypothetical protein